MLTITRMVFKGTGGAESGIATATLIRNNIEILQMDVNERGGLFHFQAPMGKQIVFPTGQEPVVQIRGAGELLVVGHRNGNAGGSLPYQRMFYRNDVSQNPIDQILAAQRAEIDELKNENAKLREALGWPSSR